MSSLEHPARHAARHASGYATAPWREALRPVRMQRVALTAGLDDLRAVLRRTGEAACVEIDRADSVAPAGNGADEVERYAAAAIRRGGTAALTGWCPAQQVTVLAAQLGEVGGTLVPLPTPRGVDPPTLLRDTGRGHRALSPLVRTFGTVPYADVDPTFAAGLTYVLMFGVMFGDVGHGALLACGAVALRSGRIRVLRNVRHLWPFVAGAGVAVMAAGLLYGEFFGPTGVVPTLWLAPLDQPMRLIEYAIGFGVVLLAAAYGMGTVNRWREGGPGRAVYAASGIAGSMLFLGAGVLAAGFYLRSGAVQIAGATAALLGLGAAGVGLAAAAPGGAGGGLQVGVELFDLVTRVGSNLVSFARLAAFGLTHAALGAMIWQGTRALAHVGPIALVAAVLLFAVGNAATFALEGLVAGVQAMRLEFYELFSRIFELEGRPFRPFRLSAPSREAAP